MTTKQRLWVYAFPLLIMTGSGSAAQLVITNLSVSSNAATLGWSSTTDRCIVAQCSNLKTGLFQYVGAVLSANQTVLTVDAPASFFRVGRVAAVDFPDPILRAAVTNAIVTWYEPRGLIYDIELHGITNLSCSSSGVTNASGLNALSDIVSLFCDRNQLANLNVEGCTNLSVLYCYNNQLTNLNVTGCTRLSVLECFSNRLTDLNVTGCVNVSVLSCGGNQLAALNVVGCTSLSNLYCYNNRLTDLNVTGCNNLSVLSCGGNYLAALNVTGCTNLSSLACYNNQLTNLDVTGCTNLGSFYCYNNQLTNLKVAGFTNLGFLDCQGNQLANLNVTGCSSLWWLSCHNNQLTNLDLSGCTNLYGLDCRTNQLKDLSAFVSNAAGGGLGVGDQVWLSGNPLSTLGTNQLFVLTNTYHVTVYYP